MTDPARVPETESYSIRLRLADSKAAALVALLQLMGFQPSTGYNIPQKLGPDDLLEEVELEFDLPQHRISLFIQLFGTRLTEESQQKRLARLEQSPESMHAKGEIVGAVALPPADNVL